MNLLPVPMVTMLLMYPWLPKQPSIMDHYSFFTYVPPLICLGTVVYSSIALLIKLLRGSSEEKEAFKRSNREWESRADQSYALESALVMSKIRAFRTLTRVRLRVPTLFIDVSPMLASLPC